MADDDNNNINSTLCPLPVEIPTLNVSEFEFHVPIGSEGMVVWETVVKSAIYASVFVLALLGNVLMMLVVACQKHMRTTVNYYLLNLAVSDLAIAIFCMWTHLIKHLTYPNFLLGPFMCRVDAFIHMTALTSSVLTMMVISCDRFFAVKCPLRARFTKQRAGAIISAIWLVAVASSIPFIFHREYSEIKWKNYVQPQCSDVWPASIRYDVMRGICLVDYPTKQIYYAFFTVALFALPITVMSVTYSLLVVKLWFSPPPGERQSSLGSSVQIRTKKKVIKLVVALLLVFVVCWMPIQVLTLYGVFGHVTQDKGHLPLWFSHFEFAAYFIAYSNSAANPIIYCGLNANFRRGMATVMFGLCLRSSNSTKSSKMTGVSERQREASKKFIELGTLNKSSAANV